MVKMKKETTVMHLRESKNLQIYSNHSFSLISTFLLYDLKVDDHNHGGTRCKGLRCHLLYVKVQKKS